MKKKISVLTVTCLLLLMACIGILRITASKDVIREETIEVALEGSSREYKIAWVSDLHLISDFEKAEDVTEESIETIRDRYENQFVSRSGKHSDETWTEIVDYIIEHDFDAVILGGDLMDYCSVKNMDTFLKGYRKLSQKLPVLYLRADHDIGWWYGGEAFKKTDAVNLHKTRVEDADSMDAMKLEFDDFVVLGIDRSSWNLKPKYLKYYQAQYEQAKKDGKNILLATHVPYASKVDESLEQFSMDTRNKIYYWGGELYQPDEITSQLLDSIYAKDTQVQQVLSGHLHGTWDGPLTDVVNQHIFSPAYEGCIGVIHLESR